MPRRTHDELIWDLTRDMISVKEQLVSVGRESARVPELFLRMGLLEQRVGDMLLNRERGMQRLWMIVGPLVGAWSERC